MLNERPGFVQFIERALRKAISLGKVDASNFGVTSLRSAPQ